MKLDEVRNQRWFEFAGATTFVLLALTCQNIVDGKTNLHTGFEFSTLAVLAAARLFNLGPALFAAALAAVGQVLLFLDPQWSLALITVGDVIQWVLFAGIAALICLLVDRLKNAWLTNERTVRDLFASDRARALSEHRLDAGLTAIGDPILILRPIRAAGPSGLAEAGPIEDFTIEYENHDAAMLHSGGAAARADHVGRRLSTVGPVHERAGLLRTYAQAYAKVGDGPVEHELDLPADDGGGGTRHVEVRAHRLGEGVVVQWRDVTARRRAESSRAISEGRYRTLVQSIGAIVWNTPADGHFVGAMPGWAAFTGQTPEQFAGLGWLDAIHPDDRARVERSWRDALAAGRPFEVERRVRRHDGTFRHMITRAVPVRDGGRGAGPVHEWLGVDTDVTERKQADAIIADNERQLRRVLNALFSFVTVTMPDGTVIGANDAPLRAANLTAADVIGKKLWDCAWWLDMPEVAGQVRDWIARAATGEIVRQDIPMRLAGEERIVVDFMIAPMRDEQGTITHLIPSAVDVSDRHRAQAELAERERRFRRLYESNLIGIAFYDHDAGTAEANAAMRAILGLDDAAADDAGESSGTIAWKPVTAPEWAEVDKLQHERLDREGRCGPFEKEYLRPDGSRVPVMVAAARIDDQRPGQGVAFAMDLTRIKRVEEALRRTEASLRAVNESLEQRIRERTAEVQQRSDQLRALALDITEAESRERKRLAQLLHDHFQQLVSAAKLKVGLLRRRLGEDSPLHDTISQAEQLLAETIDASRSLATELSPPVLHDAGLEPALDWLARRMERDHHLLVDVRVDPGCEPDNEQVRVILFECAKELLFNVHKHSGADRATLTVTMPSTGLLQLSVSDEGRGFDPFMVEVKPKPDGSFGLFSIKERLSLLGGIVRVRSHAGSGTQVLLTVPVAVRADGQPNGGSRRAPHDSVAGLAVDGVPNVRVLVADDHKLFREGLISLIGQEPFVDVVGQANDGQEAVELAHALKPDILICDITMPKLNGVQVTQQLSREMPELKIIGLSMHERDDMATAMRDAGAVAYCTKGGPTETLLGVLRGVAGATATQNAVPAETPEAPAV